MITITIDNYKNEKLTYTMSDMAEIEIWSENVFSPDSQIIKCGLNIEVTCANGIETKREKLK